MLTTKTFKGANVFMSRNLVPPEVFDALLDALKQNGAEVFLCCDPSRSGPNDFHVISSPDHEKFELLRSKGCNLLGPPCVLSCAKEHRALPKQGFTCCLAMDGVKILASGFDMDEKVKIEKLVTAMGGLLHTRASLDVSFVIVKNVLAAKYKWALNVLKKPVVTVSWLYQCWNEHRVVPQEPYRVLPFSGLTICVTRIPAGERKEIEKHIIQNGGKYSPELTKKCTHLISDAPEGDKYKVAIRWGHIHIVTKKWFDQSVMRKACLNEEAYPVQGASLSINKSLRHSSMTQHSQDKSFGNSASFASSVAADSSMRAVPCAASLDPDLEATLSQKNMSSMFSDPPVCNKDGLSEIPAVQAVDETNFNGCIANDSQSEDNDLYLSECRISLVGFEASMLRKLVGMVRRGGGSRYMSLSDKLTHIVVGAPSEAEKKELRGLAASGVINVVRTTWLEDCDREKKEMPVLQQHVANNLILPKDSVGNNRGIAIGMAKGGISSHQSIHSDLSVGCTNTANGMTSSLGNARVEKPEISLNGGISLEGTLKQSHQNLLSAVNDNKDRRGMPNVLSDQNLSLGKSSTVFKGKTFRFSKFFPEDRKAEIIRWIGQGGGEVINDYLIKNVHFIIECHGVIVKAADVLQTAYVSSHWIRSCLEEGCLLDVGSHIIYSPVQCQIPLPGFENLRFCISQYEEKDRLLLRNLCFVLGAKFVEKLTRKVTHLLCKFKIGPKYEAACKWGICSITCEWIYECIRQNEVVAMDPFRPKEVTSQDEEAGLCAVSQFPTQAGPVVSGEFPSQLISRSQDLRNTLAPTESSRIDKEALQSLDYSKKARLLEEDEPKGAVYSKALLSDSVYNMSSTGVVNHKDSAESSHSVPDVAAAIEDLLEQTSKIHEQMSPGRTECDKSLFPSDCSMLGDKHGVGHSVFGLPKHWLNRTGKKDEVTNSSRDANEGIYDGFSETQTESQVVGYEEDLSGRQMLIDRVRTRSSMA